MKQTPKLGRQVRATLLAGTFAAGLGAIGAGTPAPARADVLPAEPVSADGAQKLEQQLHDWLTGFLGPHADLGDRPFQVTADSDRYKLEIPFAGPLTAIAGVDIRADPVTAELTPLDGGRWQIDDIQAPSPLHVGLPIPAAGATSGGSEVTTTFASQEQHAVVDPSLATPSHWDSKFTGYKSVVTGSGDAGTRTTSLQDVTAHVTWEPGPDGRLNVAEAADGHLLVSNAVMPDVGLVSFSVERSHGEVKLDGVSTDKVATLLHAAFDLAPVGIAAAQRSGGDSQKLKALADQNRAAADEDRRAAEADRLAFAAGKLTPADRKKNADDRRAHAQARMKAMQEAHAAPTQPAETPPLTADQQTAVKDALLAVADLLSGFDEHGTMENLHATGGGHSGHLDKLAAGFSASAPDGKVLIRFNLALDGLDSPDIPPGVYRDYLPRHLSISPRIGGLPAAGVHDLLVKAADSGGNDPALQEQAMALLNQGPVAVGLDELSLDFGPATLKGTGEVRVSSISEYEGEAHLVATGLDELIKQASTVPALKEAGPVLFLLKGMGKQDGATTVWDLSYKDGKALVNGNDLAGMIPGAK